ncbi:MAG TPA: protein kinase [Terriglobales bacterium]
MAASPLPQRLAGRYEIRQILGQGGMGLVYRAYDTVVRREVALKTLRDAPDPAALQLFYKECDVLASMSHPNIVEIFDIGELEDGGKAKPYFVMPLLPGTTLESLIGNASHRLTVERTVEILSQTCRGLQAAHERGLVHRDLKPSNIFVMDDDSVKIIDFGVAHIADRQSTMGQKGTLLYMSPEQIQMKPLSALSDIFSLSVVCYEALTGRQPFRRPKVEEIATAILEFVPPPASELNAAVNDSVSRVVHKGMAKQPWHRFSMARDFADALNKALRNQPIEFFDPVRLRPRLERATKAMEAGDYQFVAEILGELEAEGHLEPTIVSLRKQLDAAVRQKTIAKLLESANTRLEESEDPLALQKIEEVLQLDPGNITALAMKSKIENRRSERQIESWYRLASQHIENHSYVHAREALENVLQLKPNEARALQLLAEIDRQQSEYNSLRQQKVDLYRGALDAWDRGEVSTALTKLGLVIELDRKAPDYSNPERSATYQNFYEKVRCEHDAINSAYAEGRKYLEDRNAAKALTVCETFLAKYPNNALFRALKFDAEEQQRQDVSAFIASVDRQAEAEPDLDRRVGILKDALARCPGEAHFERALRLVQDKRDLVNSIVARAHLHEEQGLFSEALSDWEVLRTIYGQYPGLSFELERLQKRREQQTRIDAKSRWTQQIDGTLHAGEYKRALQLLQEAMTEFPDDAELREMCSLAQSGAQRTAEVERLISTGQALCGNGQFDEGIGFLRQAAKLDEHSSLARAVLASALVEESRSLLETDWRRAEDMVQEALTLNPGHAQAKNLRTLILDRKKEEFVSECVAQARRLLSVSDAHGALACVEEGLRTYTFDPRLIQVRDALRRRLSGPDGEHEQPDTSPAPGPDGDGKSPARKSVLPVEMPERYPSPGPLSTVSDVPRPAINRAGDAPHATLLFSPPGAAGGLSPAAGPAVVLAEAEETEQGTTVEQTEKTSLASRMRLAERFSQLSIWITGHAHSLVGYVRSTAPALAARVRPRAKLIGLVTGVVVVLIAGSVVAVKYGHRTKPKPVVVASVAISIHTNPPGAAIRVNNELRGNSDLQLEVKPGTYRIEAAMDGYEPFANDFEVKSGSPAPINLDLKPAATVVRVISDSEAGKVWLDDNAPIGSQEAKWSLENPAGKQHTVKYAGPDGRASFTFTDAPAALPEIASSLKSSGLHAILVTALGSRARLYCSCAPAKLSVDGQSTIDLLDSGVDLQNLSAGSHHVIIQQAKDEHAVDVEAGPAPTLSAYLQSDQNIGSLLIITGEDKVQVFINGTPYKRLTRDGRLRIPSLELKEYVIRVSKEGFQEVPEQRVQVAKGEQARLTFKLQPLPHQATLTVQGGIPGTEVLVDHASAGTVQPDGSFRLPGVSLGEHVVELRKDGFKSKQLHEKFSSGQNVVISEGDARLEALPGEITISFLPSDADVTITKSGEAPRKVTSGTAISLPAGTYTVTARSGSIVKSIAVEVVAGQSQSRTISLLPGGMEDWDAPPGAWRSENNVYVRRGGNFILYKTPPLGTLVFSAMLRKGHRLQWVLNYKDDKNYELYQMDDDFLYRGEMQNGQVSTTMKIPYKSDNKKFRTFQIHVSTHQITTDIQQNNNWKTLDIYQTDAEVSAGRFGFLIPGKDEVALSNFSHYGGAGQ